MGVNSDPVESRTVRTQWFWGSFAALFAVFLLSASLKQDVSAVKLQPVPRLQILDEIRSVQPGDFLQMKDGGVCRVLYNPESIGGELLLNCGQPGAYVSDSVSNYADKVALVIKSNHPKYNTFANMYSREFSKHERN